MALLFVRSHIKIHEQNIIYEYLCMHGFGPGGWWQTGWCVALVNVFKAR